MFRDLVIEGGKSNDPSVEDEVDKKDDNAGDKDVPEVDEKPAKKKKIAGGAW